MPLNILVTRAVWLSAVHKWYQDVVRLTSCWGEELSSRGTLIGLRGVPEWTPASSRMLNARSLAWIKCPCPWQGFGARWFVRPLQHKPFCESVLLQAAFWAHFLHLFCLLVSDNKISIQIVDTFKTNKETTQTRGAISLVLLLSVVGLCGCSKEDSVATF